MPRKYIEFIHAYCDSWCERCAFTERCSHYAVTVAMTMCDGDLKAAIELAIGKAREPGAEPRATSEARMADRAGDVEIDDKELEDIGRELHARGTRVHAHPLAETSQDYAVAAHRWLEGVRESAVRPQDALDVVRWDLFLIHAKICRALDGRDAYPNGGPFARSALQSDWNGSAKVALISIERSERAWRAMAEALMDEAAGELARLLARLRQQMLAEFPKAMAFRRPGFDDGG
jgi:hypothetical protein